jgi:hypothetical protein
MTMYLPNPDVGPIGFQAAEFIDVPSMADEVTPERGERSTVPLDHQTRLDIARWAHENISGLVDNHNGDPEDVLSVIHDLHDRTAFVDRDTRHPSL